MTVNQVLLEIETAKAVVELPSPYAGTVGELLVEPGATVNVGEPIIAIETGAAPAPAEGGATIGEAGADGRIATLVGYGPRPGAATRRPRPGRARARDHQSGSETRAERGSGSTAGDQATAPVLDAPAPVPSGGSLVPLAKPPVRKLAKDLGVDLRALTGSGPGGVITREDVQTAAAGPIPAPTAALGADPHHLPAALSADPHQAQAQAQAPAAASGGVRREPIRGVRKATAAAMVQSAFTAPHVTEFLTVDVTETLALRDRLRASRAFADVKLTPLAFVAKAVCLAVRRTPAVNASWDEPAGEIVYYDRVRLGIAAATPRGLMVPKIADADRLDLHGLAVALAELTETARAGKTPPSDLVNGTITITNVGVFGMDTGTPILNPGEVGIVALGTIKQKPWVVDGEVRPRMVTTLGASFDHRIVDGDVASRFLADVAAIIEEPALLLD